MSHDVIVLGAGVNGLTVAATLGKAGKRVLVLDRADAVGGTARSVEFHPGYHTHGLLADTSGVRSWVADRLELSKHGLSRRADEVALCVPATDGPGLRLTRDPAGCQDEFGSSLDADGYQRFRRFLDVIRPFVADLHNSAPLDLGASTLRDAWPMLTRGWAMRKLGRRTMMDLLRVAPMSAVDWMKEWFEGDLVKAAIVGPAMHATWLGPRAAGTAALVLARECTRETEIAGGPPALVRALTSACEAHGVEIRTHATTRRILCPDGRATGVVLEGGETIEAAVVVSTLEPRHTLMNLVAPAELPLGLEEIASWRCRGTTAVLHLALDGPLELAHRDGRCEWIQIGDDLASMERAFDAVKYGEVSNTPVLDVRVPTLGDKTLAPDGHHVATVLAHFVPYHLRGGWDEDARDEVLQRCLVRLAEYAPTLRDRVVGHQLLTPLDLEQRYGLTGGHLHHGEAALDQWFWLRPTASCARYLTPIDGLVLAGSGSHPGGGVTMAPGGLAARTILGN